VFDGRVPSEVVIIRTCLPSQITSGVVLVSAAANLVDGAAEEPGDLRLWLTRSGGAIWRVTPTGRLALAGAKNPDRAAPNAWLDRLRFVSEVVSAVMGEDAPPASAFDDPAGELPPLRPPVPSGPAWQAIEPRTLVQPPGLSQVTTWSGGYVGLARDRFVDDDQASMGTWTSIDGVRWRISWNWLPGLRAVPEQIRVVGFGDGVLAIAVVGQRLWVWQSDDGLTWRRLPDRPIFGPPPGSPVNPEWNLEMGEPEVSAGRLRIAAAWHYGICGNHCDDFYVRRVWTTTDGIAWRASRPSRDSRTWNALQTWGAVAAPEGFVGLRPARRPPGEDPEASCGPRWRLWASAGGVRWSPIAKAETVCLQPVDLVADPDSGVLYLLGTDREDRPHLLRSDDRRGWTPVAVPFPAGWSAGAISVRGRTLVINGGREHATGSIDGPEDSDWRAEPLISMDGGATWEVSTSWPALMDGMTRAVIGDGIIVAGAEHPTSAIYLETP
jgi:hypothetical protein